MAGYNSRPFGLSINYWRKIACIENLLRKVVSHEMKVNIEKRDAKFLAINGWDLVKNNEFAFSFSLRNGSRILKNEKDRTSKFSKSYNCLRSILFMSTGFVNSKAIYRVIRG